MVRFSGAFSRVWLGGRDGICCTAPSVERRSSLGGRLETFVKAQGCGLYGVGSHMY
jgi:hypothetical protein